MFHSRPNSPNQLKDTFRVLIRVNPTKDSCWDIHPPVLKNHKQEFVHDAIFLNENNLEIYTSKIEPMIQQSMDGYNMTLFAYGTTSSGKTHSIFGSKDEIGIIPLALESIFNIIQESDREYLLRVSFLEIYNEQIKDLLAENQQPLRILENKARGAFVWPIQELVVTSKEQCIEYVEQGLIRRHSASTNYNLYSSRSHAIFQIIIESRHPTNDKSVQLSTLNLIDLAGSEKSSSNKQRQLESHYINRSLLSLAKVISLLIQTNGNPNQHIPYRDSKLTRILQTPLSGNALCLVLCCINPTTIALEESINTMHFATRIRKMLVKAGKSNIMDEQALLSKYRNEIKNLQHQLQQQPAATLTKRTSSLKDNHWEVERTELLSENNKYKQELLEQELLRTALKDRIDHLTRLILTSSRVKEESKLPVTKRPMSIMALSDLQQHRSEDEDQEEDALQNKLIKKEAECRKLTWQMERMNNKLKQLEPFVGLLNNNNLEEAQILAMELAGKTPSIVSMELATCSNNKLEMQYKTWKQINRICQQRGYKERINNLQLLTEMHLYLEIKDDRELIWKIAELEAELTMAKSIYLLI